MVSVRSFLLSRNHQPGSEPVLHAELHNPLEAAVGLNAAELRLREIRRRISPIEMVRQVERLDAELEVPRRSEIDQARERRVDLPECRPFHRAVLEIAERPWRRRAKGRTIEIAVQRLR